MAKYRVHYWTKRDWKKHGSTQLTSPEFRTVGEALFHAQQLEPKCKVVTVVRDSEGEDHPDNKGKWFLEQIVK